jgi:hypothetical protein
MNTFFCSDNSRNAQEDMIGSATNCDTYVLIECRPPWAAEPFDTKWLPENLRKLQLEIKKAKLSVKFLLIANNESHKANNTTLLIYQAQKGTNNINNINNSYSKHEFLLPSLEEVAGVVKKCLAGGNSAYEVEAIASRDILVCTHGSRDRCCARYGNPFYYHAQSTIADLGLKNIRLWKSSHIGGHRFAPTMIDLPQGRYYGGITQEYFQSILTRSGDIDLFNQIYRGWGMFPESLQVLERELIQRYGWSWFDYKVSGRILEENEDRSKIQGEISFTTTDGSKYIYLGEITKNNSKSLELKVSCNAVKDSLCQKYSVTSLSLVAEKAIAFV